MRTSSLLTFALILAALMLGGNSALALSNAAAHSPMVASIFLGAPEPITAAQAPGVTRPALRSFSTRPPTLKLENQHLQLLFYQQLTSDSGWGVALAKATLPSSAYSFSFEPEDLWAMTLRASDGVTMLITPSSANAAFSVTVDTSTPTQTLTAVWDGITPANPSATGIPPTSLRAGSLVVTVTVTLGPDDPYALWRIAVDNRDAALAVHHVDFPRLSILPVGAPATNQAVIPYFGGRLINDPVHSIALQTLWKLPAFFSYPHMYAPLQLFSYFDSADGNALYLAAHDGAGCAKAFDFRADGQRLVFGVRQFPAYNITPGNDYNAPYPVAIGALPGDWYDVAKQYRAWALQQPWSQRGPLALSDDFSHKLKASDIMGVWNPFTNTAEPFEAVALDMARWREFLGIDHISGLWYGWHHNAFDTGWPEYEPVQPSFPGGITLTHRLGHYAWPYILPKGWDTALASYTTTHAADYAMKDENGHVRTFTTPPGAVFALMDPATTFWQEYVRDWVLDLQNKYDVDGVYLDVWSGSGYGFDYDPNHGHPTGGGNYIAQGMRTQGKMIRDAARGRDPDFIMMSEHPGEAFIDLLEIENVEYVGPLNAAQWWTLPLFNTVYHDYIMMSTFVNTSAQLPNTPAYEEALAYGWTVRYSQGNLLAVNGDGAPVLQDPVQSTPNYGAYLFLRKLVQSYAFARPYLLYGERLRDLPVTVQKRSLSDIGGGMFAVAPYGAEQPVIYASVWRSHNDDSVGLVFTNWVTATESITYTFAADMYDLPAEQLGLYRLDEQGEHLLTTFSGALTRTDTLRPRSVLVLTVRPIPPRHDQYLPLWTREER